MKKIITVADKNCQEFEIELMKTGIAPWWRNLALAKLRERLYETETGD